MQIDAVKLKEAVQAVTNVDPGAVSQDAAQRFAELMQTGPLAPPQAAGAQQTNPIAAIAHAQDAAIHRVANDAVWLGNNLSGLAPDKMFAAAMLVQVETASLTVDMQAKMATITASKDALSTLMKNQ
ncbi:Type III secretion protein HrpB2 [plant metagenome]|uniref:Type III secretion protein HrpB2 n=1 Tax=plant metagenome TaxID=1297885 RepID=A0A484VDH7_9ZZZZ